VLDDHTLAKLRFAVGGFLVSACRLQHRLLRAQ